MSTQMKMFYTALAALLLALSLSPRPAAAETHKVNIFLVSPPGETWTDAERLRAVGATLDATAWWTRNSKTPVPGFELGWTAVITPADFDYSLLVWENDYLPCLQDDPATWPQDLTVFVIDNSASHSTLDGAPGFGHYPYRAVTVILSGVNSGLDGLAVVVAHEYGHAVLNLRHAPVGSFDIMAPSAPQQVYPMNTIGYYTRTALGEEFAKTYFPVAAR